jgi:hypothetical protein
MEKWLDISKENKDKSGRETNILIAFIDKVDNLLCNSVNTQQKKIPSFLS